MGQVKHQRPPYGIIAVLMIGAFIAFLNNTLLNVALPSMMADLNVGPATIQWLTTGFMLVNGILIPTTAYLIQKYSVRRLFLVAMGLFTIGTIVAGTATIFPILLIARMVQASGSAIMMPVLNNVMLVSFPIEKRGAAMGVFGLILMFAPAIGPTLSGWIVEHYNWRALFHFVTPIAATVFIIGFFLLKDKKDRVEMKLDSFSLLLSSVGFGGLLFGFSNAGENGWNSVMVTIPLVLGIISIVVLILRQLRLFEPMLNFRVYKYPMFALSSAITMITNMAMFSGMLLLPIYVQSLRGISPMDSGLMLLPGALANAFMSPINGRLFDKYGGRILAIIGLSILVVTTYFFSELTFETSYTSLMILHAIRMFGISMVFMPVSTNGLNQLPRKMYPHGVAVNNTLNQVAGAIGTAVMVTIMSSRQEVYTDRMIAAAGGTVTKIAEQQIKAKAMLEGINDAFYIATIFATISLVLSFFIKRSTPADEQLSQEQDAEKVRGKLAAE